MFNNIEIALDWLQNKKKKQKRTDLSRITNLAKIIDVYDYNFKIIHIAGTNGKGSTAMYINNILLKLGYKVGLFTSPYIVKFNERIIINNNYINDLDLLNLINYIYPIITTYEEENADLVPFFEILTLIALKYFKENNLDYVVLECGIGGRFDATNFIKPIISIITSIGYDHQQSLGEDILDICYHKCGIIKENTPIFTISNSKCNDLIISEANKLNAKLFLLKDLTDEALINNGTDFYYDDYLFHTPLYGLYQANNASLMIAVIKYLFNLDNDFINESLKNSFIPGRFEIINNYILDGAHNISAIKLLVKTLKDMNISNLSCIFTSLKDKRYQDILPILDQVVNKYIFVNFADLRSVEANVFVNITKKPNIICKNIDEALAKTKREKTLITGSLHFVSFVRSKLIND